MPMPVLNSAASNNYYKPQAPSKPAPDIFQANTSPTLIDPTHQADILKTQKAFSAARNYHPIYKWLDGNLVPVHNPIIAEKLQDQYTASSFQTLFDFCKQKGVFNLTIVPSNGLVKTAGTTAAEDSSMGHAHWVSDTLYVKELVKDIDPALWKKSLAVLAKYYGSEQASFEKIIQEPSLYGKGDGSQGVAHIFDPNTLTRFTDWQVNYRLESHGLALKAFCDDLQENINQTTTITPVDKAKLNAICYLAHYFQALDYPHIKSCGPWEESPDPNGMTTDIEAVRSGYDSLRTLLFDTRQQSNPKAQQIRSYLQLKELNLNQKLKVNRPLLFQDPAPLNQLIQNGENIVRQRLAGDDSSGFLPIEGPSGQKVDSASLLAINSNLKLGSTLQDDVEKHLNRLEAMAHSSLLRDNGMPRYLPYQRSVKEQPIQIFDSYLGVNSNLSAWPSGKLSLDKDAEAKALLLRRYPDAASKMNTPAEDDTYQFYERGQLATQGKEAEWFLVSELSLGYGKQLNKLLKELEKKQQPPSPREKELIDRCLKAETQYLNRAYARITGNQETLNLSLKANGEYCPPYKVPEAYQYVSTRESGPVVAMPGINTPLAWATASLYSASKQYQENLIQLELLNRKS
jgi:hypothetical protein